MKVREVSFDFQSINSIRKNKEIRFDELIPDWAIKWLQHFKKSLKTAVVIYLSMQLNINL